MEPEEEAVHEAREIINDAAPDASRVVLGNFIGWTQDEVADDPAGALAAAIDEIPDEGAIRSEGRRRVVKAMIWLIGSVPGDHTEREKLDVAVDDLRQRAGW